MTQMKMTSAELMIEVEWLLSYNIHPEQVAAQVGRSPEAIGGAARRQGHREIARIFNQVVKKQQLQEAA